jgi:hypothetical protein
MNELKNKKLNMKLYGLGMLVILAFGTMILPVKSYALVYGMTCSAVGCNYNYQTAQGIVASNSGTPAKDSGSVLGASTAKSTESVSTIAANAVYGSNGFIPSGIMGWILFAILMLIIVILVRKVFGGERNYHSTPLKQA